MSVHKYGDTVYDWENGVVYNVKRHSESYRYRTFEEAKVSKNGKGVVLDGIFHSLEDTFPMTQVTRELEKSKKYHELQIDRLYWEERLAEVNRRLKDVNKAIGEQVKEAVSLVPKDAAFWLSMYGGDEETFRQRQEFFKGLGLQKSSSFYKDTRQYALEVSLTDDLQKAAAGIEQIWPFVLPVSGYKLLEYGTDWVERKYLATKAGNDQEWYALTLTYTDDFRVDFGPGSLLEIMEKASHAKE